MVARGKKPAAAGSSPAKIPGGRPRKAESMRMATGATYFYNAFTASATMEGVPFRPDILPFMEMHFSASKSSGCAA